MPSPRSPLKVLRDSLRAAPSLKGFVSSVELGKNALAKQRSPPSIVLYALGGPLGVPADNVDDYADVDLRIAFQLWGSDSDGDEVWDLRSRLIAALYWQKNPDPFNDDDSTAGFFFVLDDEVWDVLPDTAQQGQAIEVVARFVFGASAKTLTLGEVDAESMLRSAVLKAAVLIGDTSAVVDSTLSYPTSGMLHIDEEQISYSSVTPTSFLGLVRGVNGTTATSHANGAAVSVTPT